MGPWPRRRPRPAPPARTTPAGNDATESRHDRGSVSRAQEEFVAAVYRDRVLDHLALQVADVDAAAAFYIEVFAPLGVRELMRLSREEGTVVG